jgi:hypothetical protein
VADLSRNEHDVPVSADPTSPPAASPPAVRVPRRSWRDPRLLVGIAIIAVSVLTGARLVGSADDTVPVWALATDVAPGAVLRAGDVERQRVRFPDVAVAVRYLPATDPLPDGAVSRHALKAGELLPRSALGASGDSELAEVPLAVPADAVPATLRVGASVDVWVTPARGAAEPSPRATRVFEEVRVVALPEAAAALGPSTSRQVIIGVPSAEDQGLAAALAQLADGTAVVVKRG